MRIPRSNCNKKTENKRLLKRWQLVTTEQEIVYREQTVKLVEEELSRLRQEKAVKTKEQEITKMLKTQFDFEMKLMVKQQEGRIRLRDRLILSLEQKIKALQIQVKEYSEKVSHAEAGVKDIALNAIESAAKAKTIQCIKTTPKQQPLL